MDRGFSLWFSIIVFFKIDMVMQLASRVELGTALQTSVCILIFADGMFPSAHTAQYGILIILICFPRDDGVRFFIIVAPVAWIILTAAFELNGNDVFSRVIMNAACLFVDCISIYFRHNFIAPLLFQYHSL